MYITIYLCTYKCLRLRKSDAAYKVLITKEDTAISLHLHPGLVSVQKRTPISDKDAGNRKKERKYEIELARESSHCKYIHRYKQEELLRQRFLNSQVFLLNGTTPA